MTAALISRGTRPRSVGNAADAVADLVTFGPYRLDPNRPRL